MSILNDENLMAFVDGELDEKMTNQVEHELKQSPEARQKVTAFKESAQMLRVYDNVIDEPIPQNIIDLFENQSTSETQNIEKTAKIIHSPLFTASKPFLSMAASVLLIAGFVLGNFFPGSLSSNNSTSAPDNVSALLTKTLELHPSGEPLSIIKDGNDASGKKIEIAVMALDTFTNNNGEPCRSFEVVHIPGPTQLGLACRSALEQWDVRMLIPADLPTADSASSTAQSYQTASGGTQLIKSAKKQMGVTDTFSTQNEKILIKNTWKK